MVNSLGPEAMLVSAGGTSVGVNFTSSDEVTVTFTNILKKQVVPAIPYLVDVP